MADHPYRTIEAALRTLPADAQRRFAIAMAELSLPFARLARRGQPDEGLTSLAAILRNSSSSPSTVDHVRHRLWSVPELGGDEELDGPAWYSLGSTVTWIYAADAMSTAPTDGVVHAFKRLADLLDAVDDELQDTDLLEQLLGSLNSIGSVDAPVMSAPMSAVELAVGRLPSE